MFEKGDKVRDIYTKEIFVVKCAYWQNYGDGSRNSPVQRDQTVEFEPTEAQPTPWNKGSNLEYVGDT